MLEGGGGTYLASKKPNPCRVKWKNATLYKRVAKEYLQKICKIHFIEHISKTYISLLSDGLGMSISQVGFILIISSIFILMIQVLLIPRVSTSYISTSDTTLFRVIIKWFIYDKDSKAENLWKLKVFCFCTKCLYII